MREQDTYCSSSQNCAVGFDCVDQLCRASCSMPTDCSGGRCEQVTNAGRPIAGLTVCIAAPCDPVDSSTMPSCGAFANCVPAVVDGGDTATCLANTNSGEPIPSVRLTGESCSKQTDCVRGHGCVRSFCRARCRQDGDCRSATQTLICDRSLMRFAGPGDQVGACVPGVRL